MKPNSPTIYDCFTFFNELDLLEIRLNELHSVVDFFVLVEANFTHQGQAKEYIFEQNKSRFSNFSHKIIHIKLDEQPTFGELHTDFSWNLEHFQRNGISHGLLSAKPNDIILISDVDEIPNKDVLWKICQNFDSTKILLMRFFYYFIDFEVNYKFPIKYYFLGRILQIKKYYYKYINRIAWQGTVVILKRNLISPQTCRDSLGFFQTKSTYVKNGGWHFSYLGGIDKIITKIASFAHTEVAAMKISKEDISSMIKNGYVIHDKKVKTKKIDIQKSIPLTLVKNVNKYENFYSENYYKQKY